MGGHLKCRSVFSKLIRNLFATKKDESSGKQNAQVTRRAYLGLEELLAKPDERFQNGFAFADRNVKICGIML